MKATGQVRHIRTTWLSHTETVVRRWSRDQFLSVVLVIPFVWAFFAAVLGILASGADPKSRAFLLAAPLAVALLVNERVKRSAWTRPQAIAVRSMLVVGVLALWAIVIVQAERFYE